MPLPEDLMRKLGRGHSFIKIDLADAYNKICLGPELQKKLALSIHKGVLLQKRVLFGRTSPPGYFHEIMDQLTQDLPGVAIYVYNIFVSGNNVEELLTNLRRPLQRLIDNGIRCRRDKCFFTQPYVD
ncbi:retrovirus-related pol polyprotein [Plakobranchus ocellatus]|uniref:Retrovirus-related pol polyprotein n=1 Tax=Plakobranchus ocellatus TaxID=259542 RepID=A0AAV3ZMQ9_9GAST|nr:retrovirus-related pol polyprotein [Plakobranchus ocellatus]